jgi:hypothetical protein
MSNNDWSTHIRWRVFTTMRIVIKILARVNIQTRHCRFIDSIRQPFVLLEASWREVVVPSAGRYDTYDRVVAKVVSFEEYVDGQCLSSSEILKLIYLICRSKNLGANIVLLDVG